MRKICLSLTYLSFLVHSSSWCFHFGIISFQSEQLSLTLFVEQVCWCQILSLLFENIFLVFVFLRLQNSRLSFFNFDWVQNSRSIPRPHLLSGPDAVTKCLFVFLLVLSPLFLTRSYELSLMISPLQVTQIFPLATFNIFSQSLVLSSLIMIGLEVALCVYVAQCLLQFFFF